LVLQFAADVLDPYLVAAAAQDQVHASTTTATIRADKFVVSPVTALVALSDLVSKTTNRGKMSEDFQPNKSTDGLQPQQPNPLSNPEQFEFFAFVVENEVAVVIPVMNNAELLVAAWSSNPKVVKLAADQKNVIQGGDILQEDGTFTKAGQ
jgi:hypothetical protein